jgi:hypothetical protein
MAQRFGSLAVSYKDIYTLTTRHTSICRCLPQRNENLNICSQIFIADLFTVAPPKQKQKQNKTKLEGALRPLSR